MEDLPAGGRISLSGGRRSDQNKYVSERSVLRGEPMGLPPQRAENGVRRGIWETGCLSVFEKETRDGPGAVVSTLGLVLERYTPGVS